MISKKDKKLLQIIGAVFGFLLLLYLFQSAYNSATGRIVTEYALNYTQIESITVDGFAVRDEGSGAKDKNPAFLYKDSSKVYVPMVADSTNVSKGDTIAIAFSDEASAQAYRERVELKSKIKVLEELKSQGGLSYVNVIGLNSLIYSSVIEYAGIIGSSSDGDLHKTTDDFAQKLTTKQIATGEKMDFDAAINEYKAEYKALESSLGAYSKVRSPYAGYFVSDVDGFENAVSYNDVTDKKLQSRSGELLLSSEKEEHGELYGKIVGKFIWYFVFDMASSEISTMNEGSTVYVNFPSRGIRNIKMTVYDITEEKNSVITVTLSCKLMNEELVSLRKEKAEIVINEHNGLKINRDALVKNSKGLDGVYVLSGNYVEFSPVDIKYYGNDYVIADKYYVIKKDEKGKSYIDYDETDKYRAIKLYDNIVVKGRNLDDGKIVS